MVQIIHENGKAKLRDKIGIDLSTAQTLHRNKKTISAITKDLHTEHTFYKCLDTNIHYSEMWVDLPDISLEDLNEFAKKFHYEHAKMLQDIIKQDILKKNHSECANYEADEEESTDKEQAVVIVIPSALVLDILKNLDKDEEESETDTNIEVS